MATEESFIAAANPHGQTMTQKVHAVQKEESGGCVGGCITDESGAITAELVSAGSPVSTGKTGLLIVEDSSGNYYLMGDEGLERRPVSVGKTLGTDTACQPSGAHLVQWTDIRPLIDACEDIPPEARRQLIARGDEIVQRITTAR